MNDKEMDGLREKIWSGALTGVEVRRLQNLMKEDPQLRAALEEDLALNHLLEKLPEAPKASHNFTALVLEKARISENQEKRHGEESLFGVIRSWFRNRAILQYGAIVTVMVFVGVQVAYHQQLKKQRTTLALSVTAVSQAFGSDEHFTTDIQPILELGGKSTDSQGAQADVELLSLMK